MDIDFSRVAKWIIREPSEEKMRKILLLSYMINKYLLSNLFYKIFIFLTYFVFNIIILYIVYIIVYQSPNSMCIILQTLILNFNHELN